MFDVWLTYPKHNFRYVVKVCFRYFQSDIFWLPFWYIKFVQKIILNGISLV